MNNLNLIKELPNQIIFTILSYIKFQDYQFDKDLVYFYFHPMIHQTEITNINFFSWYGINNPDNLEFEDNKFIIHTIYDRPYSRSLEKCFGNISKHLYDGIIDFRFRNDVIDNLNHNRKFAGTFGPMKKGKAYNNFHRLDHMAYYYSPPDKIEYFNQMNVSNDQELIDNIINKIIKSIINYQQSTNNILSQPKMKKYKSQTCVFYHIKKPISDSHKIFQLNLDKAMKRSFFNNNLD
jgi:hypothetical protein